MLESWSESGEEKLSSALLLINLAASVLASSLLLIASSSRPTIGCLAFLTGLDALLNQGGSVYLQLDGRPSSGMCRAAAISSLYFPLLFSTASGSLALGSLALGPSGTSGTPLPPPLRFLLPPLLAFAISAPLSSSQFGSSRFIHDRYTCGFVNVSKVYATVILLVGFIFPYCLIFLFWLSEVFKYKTRHEDEPRADRTIIFLVSLCSVLLIPYIIQINYSHFSSSLLKTTKDNEIVFTGVLDSLAVWLRYEFDLVTPLILLLTVNNIRDVCEKLRGKCKRRPHLLRYVKSAQRKRVGEAKRTTPVLLATTRGLKLVVSRESRFADPPLPPSPANTGSGSGIPEVLRSPRGKRQRKIVRFANSVEEISWNDGKV